MTTRRRILAAGGLAILSAISMLLSGAAAPASAPPATTSSSGPSAPATRHPRVHFFVGEVAEVILSEGRLSVRETLRDGSPKVTFFVTAPDTTVSRGKDKAALADVGVNDHVTIKYTEAAGGEKRAISIRVTPSAKAVPKPTI